MDKIFMRNMLFYGYHGVLSEEKTLGQMFSVDVTMGIDLRGAGKSDDLDDTVSYAEVYQDVKDIVEKESYNLLEAVAEKIAGSILNDYDKVMEVIVEINKPHPPVDGVMDCCGVRIERRRNA